MDALIWALPWYYLPLVGVAGWVLGVLSDRLLERRSPANPFAHRPCREWEGRERWTQ